MVIEIYGDGLASAFRYFLMYTRLLPLHIPHFSSVKYVRHPEDMKNNETKAIATHKQTHPATAYITSG
jgi:hypothetical protein